MTLEHILLSKLPVGESHVELTKPDGRKGRVLVCIEHGRVWVTRKERAYTPNGPQVYVVRRWKRDCGDWHHMVVPDTDRWIELERVAAGEPIVVELPS